MASLQDRNASDLPGTERDDGGGDRPPKVDGDTPWPQIDPRRTRLDIIF